MSTFNQSTLDAQDAQIPQLMLQALKKAYEDALRDGFEVIESKNGYLVKTHPDGTSTPIKALPPRRKVQVGQIIRLK